MKKFKIKIGEYIKKTKFYEIEVRFNRLSVEEQKEILQVLEYLRRIKIRRNNEK